MQITISDTPIEPEDKPKNVYRLELRFMHGDGDYYDNQIEAFEDTAELTEFLNFLISIDTDERSWDNIKSSWVANVPNPDNEDYWDENVYNFWPSDMTCDFYPAQLDYWNLSWFNEDGIEFNCIVTEIL